MVAKAVGIGGKPNLDGDYSIIARDGDRTFEVVIELADMRRFVELFQTAEILKANEEAKNVRTPVFEAIDVHVAHAGIDAELMVATLQIGAFVLKAGDEFLRKMKYEIDRALTYRSASPIPS